MQRPSPPPEWHMQLQPLWQSAEKLKSKVRAVIREDSPAMSADKKSMLALAAFSLCLLCVFSCLLYCSCRCWRWWIDIRHQQRRARAVRLWASACTSLEEVAIDDSDVGVSARVKPSCFQHGEVVIGGVVGSRTSNLREGLQRGLINATARRGHRASHRLIGDCGVEEACKLARGLDNSAHEVDSEEESEQAKGEEGGAEVSEGENSKGGEDSEDEDKESPDDSSESMVMPQATSRQATQSNFTASNFRPQLAALQEAAECTRSLEASRQKFSAGADMQSINIHVLMD